MTTTATDRAPGCICVLAGPYVEGPDIDCPVHGRRRWALYGHLIPDGEFLGGCWLSILVGPFPVGVEPPEAMPGDEPGGGAGAPRLGLWDWKPTEAEQRAVLPPEAGDPHDTHPDPHHVVMDDQCPMTGRACDRPCGGACLRGQEPQPAEDGCPDDPDGLHHSGCGCDDVDPINPNG